MFEIFFAVGAGVISFLSPCVLPLIPGYIAYISGSTLDEILEKKNINLLPIILFTLGFSLVFIIFGAAASFIGQLLLKNSFELRIFAGIVIIIFSLHIIGIINIKFLNYEKRIQSTGNKGFFAPILIGMAFAFGWSPCIGPILGSVLAIAINDSVNGTLLLTIYSIGLGVPFLIVGLMMGRLIILSKNLAKFSRYFQILTGLILLVTGILILNGTIQSLGFQLNSILPSLEMLLI